MKKLIVILSILALVGCTKKKPACELTEKYSLIAAERIGGILACKNTTQIGKDLQDKVEKLDLCETPTQTGLVAAIVCKPVAAYVTNLIVDKALPKKWECSGGVPAAGIEVFIYQSCSALPF